MTHIVFILPTYLPETFGGAEQQTRRMAQALIDKGIRVTLLAPKINASTPSIEQTGLLTIQRFRLRHPPNLGGRYLGSFLLWCTLLGKWLFLHRHEYDIIHIIHGRLHAVPAVFIGKLLKKPVLIKLGRGGNFYFDLEAVRQKRFLGFFCSRLIQRKTTGFIANSQEIICDLKRWEIPLQRIHAIPNGVTLPDLKPRLQQNHHLKFISLGRLDPEKNIADMIQAVSKIPSTIPISLDIIGDGVCRQDLESLSIQLNARHRIHFHGAIEDVRPFLHHADFYLSTSLSEGMSNALLEAMSFAIPPLVSEVSGVVELVHDRINGFLFQPGNLAELTQKLLEAIHLEEHLRHSMGQKARKIIQSKFTLEMVVKQHQKLYQELLNT